MCSFLSLAGRSASAAVRLSFVLFVAGACLFGSSVRRVNAQPVIDQFVSSADVTTIGNCSLLRINFHVRVRYTGHFPQDRGDQLSINLQLVDREAVLARRLVRREGIRIERAQSSGIQDVYLALDEAKGPVLVAQFAGPVAYQVVQSGSFETIAVVIARKGPVSACKVGALFPTAPAPGAPDVRNPKQKGSATAPTSVRKEGPQQSLTEADIRLIEGSMDEARAAVRKGNFSSAIAILRRVLKYPENSASAEAQELLGVAFQKSGQTAAAQAEYEDYLRRYQSGEGSERVRQRLAAILTATSSAPERPRDMPAGSPDTLPVKAGTPTGETRWSVSGSASTTFITNDSTNAVKDLSTAPNPNADADAHRVHQNTLLTNIDVFGTADNDRVRTKFKLAFTHERQFDTSTDKYGVSTAQVDYTLKEADVTLRVGRQSRNTGGVIGRFDGAVVSWQQSPAFRFNVLAGSPNWSRFDAPFKDNKSLYGASIDFGKILGGLETSVYLITQYDRNVIDRQAVGAEFRYFDSNKSILGTIDYDTYFRQLNAAIFSGTYTLEDKSVFNASVDYRKVPYLSTWNALQGQPFLTLYDMMKFNTAAEIKQFAIDRTPTFESAMISYSKPLNDTWQVSTDATVTNLTGTLPSGGVDGTPASGLEYYLSAQLTGNNIFTPGDLFMGAVRYASLADSKIYVLDLNSRYPITPNLSVSPRVRLGYRTGTRTDLKEYTFLPSFLATYLWSNEISTEAEIGYRYVDSTLANIKSTTKDLFATVTLRRDFGADGVTKCQASMVSCAWARPAAMAAGQSPGAGLPVKSSSSPFASYALEAGLRYWYSSGQNRYRYFADQTGTAQVSRLAYSGLTGHTGEMFFRVDALDGPFTNMFLKGYVGAGKISSGSLVDEDFAPFVNPSSKTLSSASGQLQYANLDVGFNLLEMERFRLGAFVGYHYWTETVDARGCTQVGANPVICAPALGPSVKVVTEQDHWHTGRAGITVDTRLWDRLSWQAEVAYAWTRQNAVDTHYFTFGRDPASGSGSGFQVETVLNYQLTDSFRLGIGGRWWHLSTDSVDSFNQLLRYTTERYGVFVQGSYKFN
ncbi:MULTISPECIES: tetratricopeptide repeat protein [unclassified Bradyrhizobium]|uniref:tetratricopeptide repeat protein n=1 Tax=unclassified Bradyrhizobium TaxID=2631580 RepID=UPI0028E72D04|nr:MULTISPECIES: tetratricopeptide repeat protein [unclassified Bradyrhizobium]